MRRAFSSLLVVLAAAPLTLAFACDSGGWRKPGVTPAGGSSSPTSSSVASSAPSSSGSAGAGGVIGAAPPAAPVMAPLVAADGGGAPPERVVVKVSYVIDEPATSSLELERGGAFRLERHVEGAAASKDPGSVCSGMLSQDVGGALWKAIDNAGFVPAESGFSKTISIPGAKAGQSTKYSFLRILTDLSMAPADENTARSLVNPAKNAISTAEKQASSSGSCTKLPSK